MTTTARLTLALPFALAANLVGCTAPVAGPISGGGASTGKADNGKEVPSDDFAEPDVGAHEPNVLEGQLAAAATPAIRAAFKAYEHEDGWGDWQLSDIENDLRCYLQSHRFMRSQGEIEVTSDNPRRTMQVRVRLANGSSGEPTTWSCDEDACKVTNRERPTADACLPSQPEQTLGCARAPDLLKFVKERESLPTVQELAAKARVDEHQVRLKKVQQTVSVSPREERILFNYGIDFDGDGWDYTTIAGVRDYDYQAHLYRPFVSGGAWDKERGPHHERWSQERFAKYRWECEGAPDPASEDWPDRWPEPGSRLDAFDCNYQIQYPNPPQLCSGG
jgi:hypothetical protein